MRSATLSACSRRPATSARKKAELALRKSEENLKQAQAIAHIGSWYLDISRNELVWSDETYRIFGVSPATPLTYEKFLSFVHPDDRDLVGRAWTAAMRGAPYDLEHRILVGGQTKWVREQAKLEIDAAGQVVTGIGTAHDITERKQAEEKVRRLAQLESAIAELGQRRFGRNRRPACWMKPSALSPRTSTSISATSSSCSQAVKSCCCGRALAGKMDWWARRGSRLRAPSRGM